MGVLYSVVKKKATKDVNCPDNSLGRPCHRKEAVLYLLGALELAVRLRLMDSCLYGSSLFCFQALLLCFPYSVIRKKGLVWLRLMNRCRAVRHLHTVFNAEVFLT